jgi:hypothetical protein
MVPELTKETEMATQTAEPIERWTANRRVALVVSIVKGETSVEEVEDWRENFLLGAEDALRSRAKETEQAVEVVCLARFGTIRLIGAPALPSDNDLSFQSRWFRQAC